MKTNKLTRFLLIALAALSLTGCAFISGSAETTAEPTSGSAAAATAASDSSVSANEATGEFSITTEDGAFTQDGTTYTITAAGTYSLSGALEGQILIEAGDGDEVVLELSGVTITNASDSPIKAISASKVEISAKKGTDNVINDVRSEKTSDDDTQGSGAIWADCDLKLKGSGTLVVNASYNNGVHTTKDLTIQKLSLKVTAPNNAIKGGDSVTVTSGTVVAISTKGDGIKTVNTDADKTGATRGDVVLEGGSLAVYAAGDGIQAAHDFIMRSGESESPNLSVFTGSYSGYTDDSASTDSYKGVKAENEIDISAGAVNISSYDDGLHANSGTKFEAGGAGTGNITISGGEITMSVYSPEGSTGGGMFGPGGRGGSGGWSGQKTVSGADGIHADGTLTISGGVIEIDSAYEGLEANVINVSGGKTYVTAVDDGVNATKGAQTAAVNVTGGYLDVNVSASGDTDGIDSNGSYTQTGGVVITRGPNSDMAAAIDADGSVSVTGGTLIILGYGRVSTGGSVKSVSLSLHSAGTHTVTVGGVKYTFTNTSAYGRTLCYSDSTVSGS